MSIDLPAPAAPLEFDGDGVLRVVNSRVTFDSIMAAFFEGAMPPEICEQYPTLDLAQVFGVIAFYYDRQEEMDAYLASRRQFADEIRKQNEAEFNPAGIRARLLARGK